MQRILTRREVILTWNIVTRMLRTYITNYLMKHSPGTMRNRPEATAGLKIIMRKSVPANRRSHSMKLFCKSGIRTTWGQRQRTDSLRQRCWINICRTSSREILRYLHMDEASPHLHIDFVPYTTGSKRGLDTRVFCICYQADYFKMGAGKKRTG